MNLCLLRDACPPCVLQATTGRKSERMPNYDVHFGLTRHESQIMAAPEISFWTAERKLHVPLCV